MTARAGCADVVLACRHVVDTRLASHCLSNVRRARPQGLAEESSARSNWLERGSVEARETSVRLWPAAPIDDVVPGGEPERPRVRIAIARERNRRLATAAAVGATEAGIGGLDVAAGGMGVAEGETSVGIDAGKANAI